MYKILYIQSNLAIRNFLVNLKLFLNAKCSLMPNFPYSYEVNGKLVTGNGSLIPISSSSKRSLLTSLTVLYNAINISSGKVIILCKNKNMDQKFNFLMYYKMSSTFVSFPFITSCFWSPTHCEFCNNPKNNLSYLPKW